MRNTRAAIGVGSDAVVQGMVEAQLAVRECLPKAGNGAHKAPSNSRAAQILKDMRQGGSKEFARLYCVALCNLADGVPIDQVEKPLLMLLAAVRAEAHIRTDRPLPAVMHSETKCQGRMDLAQLQLANSPESIEAHEAVLAEHARYAGPFQELGETVRERLAVLRAAPRPAYGTRRGPLQLHS